MTYRVFNSIFNCAEVWDRFLPQNHHLASCNCAVVEQSKLEDVAFRYVIISDDHEEIIAVVYFQLLNFHSKHYAFPLSKNILLQQIERRLMKKGFTILVCGNLLRIDAPGIYYDPIKTKAASIFSVLESFFSTITPHPHAILIKDWNRPDDENWISQFKFRPWPADLTMKLDLQKSWKSFEDYVKALRHRYAQRVRKARNKLFPVERRELSSDEIEKLSSQLESLYLEVVKRQSIRMMYINDRYFIEMKKTYADRFRLFGYFLNNELVGFSSNIIQERLWELHLIGMNYEANNEHWLYFNILYDAVSDMILGGKEELELGRTARVAKASIGALPVYFKNYVRISGLIPRTIVRLLGSDFNQKAGTNWIEKKIFKYS